MLILAESYLHAVLTNWVELPGILFMFLSSISKNLIAKYDSVSGRLDIFCMYMLRTRTKFNNFLGDATNFKILRSF